jgi:hypothetical protein
VLWKKYMKIKKQYMNQQTRHRLTTATITTPLGVLPLHVHVVPKVGQAVGGMVQPWRMHRRGLELQRCRMHPRWWCWLRHGWWLCPRGAVEHALLLPPQRRSCIPGLAA